MSTHHDNTTGPLAPPIWIGPLKVDPPILQAPMAGFTNYPNEWWHYTLADEPYPDTYFDVPVE